jgi:penicillin-binding protein 1C
MDFFGRKKVLWKFVLGFLILFFLFFGFMGHLNSKMQKTYQENQSYAVTDRNGKVLFIQKNIKGNYSQYIDPIPQQFKNLLIKKEDKYFYWHFGFNPWAILQALEDKLGLAQRKGSSTLTQQLAKILLSKENERNLGNKALESFYALALEIFNTKKEILEMYANSAYFGNQLQGLKSASLGYFKVDPNNLTEAQTVQLLATINSPTNYNPASELNIGRSNLLAEWLNLKDKDFSPSKECWQNLQKYFFSNQPILELASYVKDTKGNIHLNIDGDLSEKTREIVFKNMEMLKTKKAKNAAVVILSLPENQILTLIGSPDPSSFSDGYQINMAEKPRQIGSTIKPFIYLLGFEKGMRPYTLIDDREYKYPTTDGLSIYPKNFDLKYYGLMTTHYALSNSINVAAVKTLDFVGVGEFSKFLTDDLEYSPPQPIDQYKIGIALGAMEMSLLDLAHYFTIFPNEGVLKNIELISENNQEAGKTVASKEYIELINKILSDRKTGIDQFGSVSDLNLPANNYALKTGTSHDFTDSWIMGYTPDFLVGVWVGNADNSATEGVSGQIGAGRIWNEVMQLMINSNYNKNTEFNFEDLKEYQTAEGIDFGLNGDNFEEARDMIQNLDQDLILNPHQGDIFVFEPDSEIVLKSKTNSDWKINGSYLGSGEKFIFAPQKEGIYQITAISESKTQTVTIQIK